MNIADQAEATRQRLLGANGHRPNGYVRQTALPQYPVDVWPAPLVAYATAVAETIGAPIDMLLVPMTAILSGVVGNRRPTLVKPGYAVVPAIWSIIMADPSTGKSPMYWAAMALVDDAQRQSADAYEYALRQYEEDISGKKRGEAALVPKPQMEHWYTNNATMEWFAVAVSHSPGIVMSRDELLGWLRDMDAYRSGKGGDRQTWLSLWSGGSLKVDRKGADTIYSSNPVVAVAGGIQPGKFPELAKDAAEDGFLARFLLSVHEGKVPPLTEAETPDRLLMEARELVNTLRPRHELPITQFSPAAFRALKRWDADNIPTIERSHPAVRPMLGKLRGQITKVAALLHHAHDPWGHELVLPEERVADAIEVVEYHRAHGIRAYELLGVTEDDRPVGLERRLLHAVRRRGGTAGRTEILRAIGNNVNADDLSRALDGLVIDGHLSYVGKVTGENGGKPADVYSLPDVCSKDDVGMAPWE